MFKIEKISANNTDFWIKDEYFDRSDLLRDTFNNNQSLPRIKEKERNKKKHFEEGKSEMGETEGGRGRQEISEEERKMRSKVFVEEQTTKVVYQLEFTAMHVKLIAIYLKPREFESNENDKSNQPKASTIYENEYNKKARRFSQLVKSYKLDMSKREGNLSVMSFKKAIFKKRPTYAPDPKPKPSISDTVSNLKQSIIYLKYKDMKYKIKSKAMTLRSSIPIDYEADKNREKLLKRLNMALPVDLKNKAQIIVNHKGDILKFTFVLSDLNCNKLNVTTSVAVMAKDDNVYLKDFSTISFRKIYIAVPKTNYEYIDPMIKKKHQNQTMKFNKVDPIWLEEQRKKRIKEYNQCRKKNIYEDIIELKLGSSICYESFNYINKVKGGTLTCIVKDEDYERWVQSIQRSELPPSSDSYQDQVESTFVKAVPDWDLVLYSK